MHVVVIGGGFAGLSAAAALCERGARVEVLEARPTLGGRASAYVDPATGECVDNGQHVLAGCYHETFRFLARIGTRRHVQLQPNLTIDVVDRQGTRSRLSCPPWPAPLHLLGGVFRWDALSWADRLAALRIPNAARKRAGSTAPMTVREWLLACGQTPRLIDLLWEPLAVATLNQSIDEASALPFHTVLRRMFTFDRRDSSLGLPVVPLDKLYAEPARAFIERHGGAVRTGARARVTFAGGMPLVSARGEVWHADAVVCAVAWHALPELFTEPPPGIQEVLRNARSTAASAIVTVNVWLDRQVTTGAFVGLPGRSMQWVFDKRALFGSAGSHLSLVASGATAIAGRTNDDLIALAIAELREALPAAREAAVTRATAVRERRATFSVAPGAPERPTTRTALRGLFLAGDWIDTGLPATIESAVVSGHNAAEAVMQDR